jgi:disulfide bond formation protein DsbB
VLSLASRLRPFWPLLAALASGAMLAAAHAFETFGGLRPCPLCLDQRNWHWGVVATGLIAFAVTRWRPGWRRLAALAVGLVLLGSFAQAAYHVAVEQHWVMAQCDARIDPADIRPLDFDGPIEAPRCDQIAWSMWGISMAGYNALISLLLALASFAVVILPERRT